MTPWKQSRSLGYFTREPLKVFFVTRIWSERTRFLSWCCLLNFYEN